MYMKVMKADGRKIVAVCDAEHIGKVYVEGEKQLDLAAHQSFYKGEFVTEELVLKALKGADSINLVGEKAVGAAAKAKLLHAGSIARIQGVPHAQVYRIE